jgi:hypothetical protein
LKRKAGNGSKKKQLPKLTAALLYFIYFSA